MFIKDNNFKVKMEQTKPRVNSRIFNTALEFRLAQIFIAFEALQKYGKQLKDVREITTEIDYDSATNPRRISITFYLNVNILEKIWADKDVLKRLGEQNWDNTGENYIEFNWRSKYAIAPKQSYSSYTERLDSDLWELRITVPTICQERYADIFNTRKVEKSSMCQIGCSEICRRLTTIINEVSKINIESKIDDILKLCP